MTVPALLAVISRASVVAVSVTESPWESTWSVSIRVAEVVGLRAPA